MEPLVTVVIPAWNCAQWIDETLESVYAQTYRNWEVVVVDDGSTDGTAEVLARHRSRIRYFRRRNGGTAAARNAGVAQARGELIAFLDNDDVWMPEKLERQVGALARWPQSAMVFTNGKTFNEAGIRTESVLSKRLEPWMARCRTVEPEACVGSLVRELHVANEIASASAVLARRSAVTAVGGFDEEIRITDDYDLWLRIARRWPVVLLRTPLYLWRWREDSQSGPVAERQYRWTEASIRVIEKHLPDAPPGARAEVRQNLARMYWLCARICFWQNRFVDARRMLRGCLRHDRLSLRALAFLVASYAGSGTIQGARRIRRRLRGAVRLPAAAGPQRADRSGRARGGTAGPERGFGRHARGDR